MLALRAPSHQTETNVPNLMRRMMPQKQSMDFVAYLPLVELHHCNLGQGDGEALRAVLEVVAGLVRWVAPLRKKPPGYDS